MGRDVSEGRDISEGVALTTTGLIAGWSVIPAAFPGPAAAPAAAAGWMLAQTQPLVPLAWKRSDVVRKAAPRLGRRRESSPWGCSGSQAASWPLPSRAGAAWPPSSSLNKSTTTGSACKHTRGGHGSATVSGRVSVEHAGAQQDFGWRSRYFCQEKQALLPGNIR